MKSILISIKPKYCELIANGTKTVEVRKTKPKLETPFKCYIYCTIGNGIKGDYLIPSNLQCGKVIGEFICDKVYNLVNAFGGIMFADENLNQLDPQLFRDMSCLTDEQTEDYLGNKDGYGWHISDLKIYDKPKELSDFTTTCRDAYCQDDYGTLTWFCKDGYGSCSVKDKEKEYPYNDECMYFDCPSVGGESCGYEDYAYCNCNGLKPITRPPQSWCYVDELEEKE